MSGLNISYQTVAKVDDPTPEEVNPLIMIGTGIMIIADMPTLKMPVLISTILKNTTLAVDLATPFMGTNDTKQILETLHKLQVLIPGLPHDSRATFGTIFCTVFMCLCGLALGFRLYARRNVTGKIRKEDWLAVVTMVFIFFNTATFIGAYRTSPHIWDASLADYKLWSQILYATSQTFMATHALVKLVFLVFYYSLSPRRGYRISIVVTGIFVICASIAGMFGVAFQCKPVRYWNYFATDTCIRIDYLSFVVGLFYMLADIVILLLPIAAVWHLKLPRREKLIVISLFGSLVCICVISINRLIQLWEWLYSSHDFMYKCTEHGIWATLELDLSFILSCLPAMKVLFFPRLKFQQEPTPENSHDSAEEGRCANNNGNNKKGSVWGGRLWPGSLWATTHNTTKRTGAFTAKSAEVTSYATTTTTATTSSELKEDLEKMGGIGQPILGPGEIRRHVSISVTQERSDENGTITVPSKPRSKSTV